MKLAVDVPGDDEAEQQPEQPDDERGFEDINRATDYIGEDEIDNVPDAHPEPRPGVGSK